MMTEQQTKIRVIVIDDSSFNRRAISDILSTHPDVTVVGVAADGQEGLKLVLEHKPDLVTVDLEMPRMDGFAFLRLLMAKRPTPVIVISTHTRKQDIFQALALGALDFVPKPAHFFSAETGALHDMLLAKVESVKHLRVMALKNRVFSAASQEPVTQTAHEAIAVNNPAARLICVGASTGGPPALQLMVERLPSLHDTAMLVAQHMPKPFTQAFAERLNKLSQLQVKEAQNRELIRRGVVYIAPGGGHMEVVQHGTSLRIRLVDAVHGGHVPSIDRLFGAVAKAKGPEAMGVILTGMGSDGSKGIRKLREVGGITLGESKDSAVVFGMPKEAEETGCIDAMLPLGSIIDRIQDYCRQGH